METENQDEDFEGQMFSESEFEQDFQEEEESEDKKPLPLFEDISPLDIALCFQKTDRILAENEKITVQNFPSNSSLGVSNNQNKLIGINFNGITDQTKVKDVMEFMLLAKGLNYHELAHLLFTDYNSRIVQAFAREKYLKENYLVDANDLFDFLNMLEDCRIETLFYIKYPKSQDYFTFCASRILMAGMISLLKFPNKNEVMQNYLILYGRKFLLLNPDYKIQIAQWRQKILSEYLKTSDEKNKLLACEMIFDAYLTATKRADRLELAYRLMKQFTGTTGHVNCPRKDGSDPDSLKDSKTMREQLSNILKLIAELQEKIIEANKSLNKTRAKGDKEDKENMENELSQSQTDAQTPDQTDEKKEEEQQSFAKGKEIQKIIERLAGTISKGITGNERLQNEISTEINNIILAKSEFGEFSGEVFSASPKEKAESKKIENVLRVLRGDLAFKLNRFQKRGKIDVLSVIKAKHNHNLNMFKQKRLNKIDKSKLGVSILLDTSGSINNDDFRNEIKATWSLSTALENLDNFVEILEFSSDYRTMKAFNGAGDWRRMYHHGTAVSDPLRKAGDNLVGLRKSKGINNLFAIIVSDGNFNEGLGISGIVQTCQKQGIKVIWILAGGINGDERIAKCFDWSIHIRDLSELSVKLNKIIKDIQRGINLNIARGGN
jgi:hypothetical protein